MNRFSIGVLACSIGIAFVGSAMAQPLSSAQFKTAVERIAMDGKSARAACASQAGNAADICKAGANGREAVARAELDARQRPSDEATRKVRFARADADFAVAKQKCNDKAGNVKDVCLKEARADSIGARAEANAEMKAAVASRKASEASARGNRKAAETSSEARKDAASEKRDADYAVAREKCDAFAGDAKNKCQDDAKARFGKT